MLAQSLAPQLRLSGVCLVHVLAGTLTLALATTWVPGYVWWCGLVYAVGGWALCAVFSVLCCALCCAVRCRYCGA